MMQFLMRRGRPTDEPKTENVRVRISASQADWCKEHGGYSVAVRKLIDDAMLPVFYSRNIPEEERRARRNKELEAEVSMYKDVMDKLHKRCVGAAGEMLESGDYDRLILLDDATYDSYRVMDISGADALKEIETMASVIDMPLDWLLADLRDKLDSGEIRLSRHGLSAGTVDECPFDWRSFVSACDDMSYDYNEAMKKIVPLLFGV